MIVLSVSKCSIIREMTFDTPEAYVHSPWSVYIRYVYGDDPTEFPVVFDPTILYEKALRAAKIKVSPLNPWWAFWRCPQLRGQLYINMSRTHDPPASIWRWVPPPYQALPSYTKQEVIHSVDADIHGEEETYWMYFAPGSGIYTDIGNTISFSRHEEAINWFLGKVCDTATDPSCVRYFNSLASAARQRGFDTIQFLKHDDMRCGNSAIEIVDVRYSGNRTCKPILFTGWNGSRPCKCNTHLNYLQCL
jgi:hypothetical protein